MVFNEIDNFIEAYNNSVIELIQCFGTSFFGRIDHLASSVIKFRPKNSVPKHCIRSITYNNWHCHMPMLQYMYRDVSSRVSYLRNSDEMLPYNFMKYFWLCSTSFVNRSPTDSFTRLFLQSNVGSFLRLQIWYTKVTQCVVFMYLQYSFGTAHNTEHAATQRKYWILMVMFVLF